MISTGYESYSRDFRLFATPSDMNRLEARTQEKNGDGNCRGYRRSLDQELVILPNLIAIVPDGFDEAKHSLGDPDLKYNNARRKNMLRKPAFVLICALCMATIIGCATMGTPGSSSTQTSKPEVFVSGVNKKDVMNALVQAMEANGYILNNNTDFYMVFGKRVEDFTTVLLYGSSGGGAPELRIQYSISEVNKGTQVRANLWMVTNPGTEHERKQEWKRASDYQMVQNELNKVKTQLQK